MVRASTCEIGGRHNLAQNGGGGGLLPPYDQRGNRKGTLPERRPQRGWLQAVGLWLRVPTGPGRETDTLTSVSFIPEFLLVSLWLNPWEVRSKGTH